MALPYGLGQISPLPQGPDPSNEFNVLSALVHSRAHGLFQLKFASWPQPRPGNSEQLLRLFVTPYGYDGYEILVQNMASHRVAVSAQDHGFRRQMWYHNTGKLILDPAKTQLFARLQADPVPHLCCCILPAKIDVDCIALTCAPAGGFNRPAKYDGVLQPEIGRIHLESAECHEEMALTCI